MTRQDRILIIVGFAVMILLIFFRSPQDSTMVKMKEDTLHMYRDSFLIASKIILLADERLKTDSIQHERDSIASAMAMRQFAYVLNNRRSIAPKHDKVQSDIMALDSDSSIRRQSALAHAIDSLRQRIRKNQ